MARRKAKYPRRPWNDGGHWVDGVWYARPNQDRGQPTRQIVGKPASDTKLGHLGADHTTRWHALRWRTVIEMMLLRTLTIAQVECAIEREWGGDRVEFRVDFLSALKKAHAAGEIDGCAVLAHYRECLLNR